MTLTDSAWIIITGALVAGSCGLLGCFLVLRRLSMLGDAISHAVLPGIVVAAMLTGSLQSLPMFVGAVVLGILTAFIVQALERSGVQGDAAIGVTFTALFALGVVMVSGGMRDVHLDLECVLYGEIALVSLNKMRVGGFLVPQAVVVNAGLLLLNLTLITLLYKSLKICAFDPEMAAAVGINVAVMHYLLMALVSVTTVGAFESVGAILVVALIIAPAATAYLLTDRLERMLLLAVAVGAAASAVGYLVAQRLDCSIAGAISTVCGGFFLLAFLFSPTHGVVSRTVAQRRLRQRVADEDVLLWGGRRLESQTEPAFAVDELSHSQEWLVSEATSVVARLARAGLLQGQAGCYRLTAGGQSRALELLRQHRLYETYLDNLGYPADHVHAAADRVEHHLSGALTAAMDRAADYPQRDPQGKPIPPARD